MIKATTQSQLNGQGGMISPYKLARISLHVSSVPDSLPCRDQEFSDIYIALEGAISEAQGSCIYISGTPGTGKTATVREVVAQLQLRSEDGELRDFNFLEINGMKLANPHSAYERLWEEISGGQRVSASNAVVLLENEFKRAKQSRTPLVILMDELDQLVTQNQGVMYNFFNWPTYHHSRLIVVAVANTMDLPERTLSNKISSRLGLTRFQFPGYTHDQLKIIIESRLASINGDSSISIMDKSAIEFAARKVASVSGDARRALDICRRAVELAEPDDDVGNEDDEKEKKKTGQVTIAHIQAAIIESTTSPTYTYLKSAPLSVKIVLCALVGRLRRGGVADASLKDILEDCERLVKVSHTNANTARVSALLFNNSKDNAAANTTVSSAIMAGVNHKKVRMNGFTHAVAELVQSGIIIQQSTKGEITANVRLNIGDGEILSAFKNDADVAGML
ncbi:origin recognition complex subunit 1 [Nadsonia fulvescens var. elongata DSM 6958]|uniref:Origin recognition complex subunit 1 n=1 Tax=Nadsonia fulvescens var. elongata DSM 6958 TaxID=857566 RepID=A0A1E3PGG4_9ASCO|nr:origin recognition complex subunit 1 [Nadsonia fulvescens var. elongata DSM 6958]